MQILSFLAFLRIVLLSLSMLFFLSAEETVFKTIPFSPLPSDRPYANRNLSAEARAQAVLQAMTLDEKLNAVGGFQLMFSPPLPRLGLRPLLFSDASQGIHLRDDIVTRLKQSTAFPCTLALAATWDPELAVLYAQSIGEECRAGDIAVLLGPGMNIYRSSECGRNFEYLGEDPYLAGRLVSSYVTGLQKTGTMATLKHFLGNNSEYLRATSDSVISERAIHEIYTPAFKAGIDAGAGAVMTSYNLVNGEWVGHSPIWVDQLLRKELGFKGLVMSDWGAIQENEKFMTTAIDLCMPDLKGIYLTDLFKEKKFSEKDLDAKILRWLTAFFKMGFYDRPQEDLSFLKKLPAHDAVALRTAQESIILLSNRNHILPLQAQTYHKILLVGPAAKGVWGHLPAPKPPAKKSSGLLGGGGSGGVEGNHLVSLKDALFHEFKKKITFKANPTDAEIKEADLVIAAVSTNDEEGFNRSFALHPQTGGGLAERCVSLNSKTILISMTGGAFRMTDFQDKVAAHLFALFLGQTQGRALVDVLMGRVNPSGKLPFTCEKEFSDSPAFQYPAVDLVSQPIKPDSGKGARIDYKEGIFVGYRWYEHQKVAPLYPFGFGLSYATFLYDHLKLKSLSLSQNQSLTLSFTITNEGKVEGTEIAQLYLREIQCTVPRPEKELKGFQKIKLKPGETKTIQMTITPQDLAFWDDKSHAWKIEEGDFQVLIGPSSVETPLTSSFTFKN